MFGISDRPQSRLSVNQLESYWREIDSAPVGSTFRTPLLWEMPSWTEICFELNWEFCLPNDGTFARKEYGYHGVYRLIALASEGDLSRPMALSRVAGRDDSGTLYIGEAGDLGARLNQLRRSGWENRNEDSHGAVRMLKQLRCLDFFPAKIGLALLFTETKDTRAIEGDLIRCYLNTFGDTPPLNYRL
jgi:hypothetical protein